jgi:hypothetical protein
MMTNLLSRKFILAWLSVGSCSLLCLGGYIHEGVYSAVMLGTVGAYITGNVAQKAMAGK